MLPPGIRIMSVGTPVLIEAATVCVRISMYSSCALNSQLATAKRPSAVKSMWLTPAQGTPIEDRSRIVRGSRKSMRLSVSAITRAFLPSGVKYRL